MAKKILCYAEGGNGEWEALCLNFDLAVHGRSFEDVRQGLVEAIAVYLEYVQDLPVGERWQFLNRRAPLGHWVKYALIWLSRTVGAYSGSRARSWAESGANAPA